MRVKKLNFKTHRIQEVGEMSISDVLSKGHSATDFKDRYYIVLDNGNLYEQNKKIEIPISKVLPIIKYVSNSEGYIIGRRKKMGSNLMKVRLSKIKK